MAVITVSREFGSEGTDVAQHVAHVLSYHFVDKELIKQLLYQYGLINFEEVYEAAPDFLARFDHRRSEIVNMITEVVRALARHGNVVILGRGAYAVLGGFSDVINVRIKASLPARVQWVMEHQAILVPAEAEALVIERDKARAAFVEFSYGIQWDSLRAFDLMVDTDKVPERLAVKWVCEAHAQLLASRKGSPGERSTRSIEVDPVLSGAVASALACQATH